MAVKPFSWLELEVISCECVLYKPSKAELAVYTCCPISAASSQLLAPRQYSHCTVQGSLGRWQGEGLSTESVGLPIT